MFTVEVQFSALFSVTRCNLPLLALPGKLQGQQVLRCLAEGNEEVGCTVFLRERIIYTCLLGNCKSFAGAILFYLVNFAVIDRDFY